MTLAGSSTSADLLPAEHASRLESARAAMAAADLDVVGLTGPEDVYYLSGLSHQGYFAFTMLLVPRRGQPVIVARAMEATTMRVQIPWVRHEPFSDGEDPADAVVRALDAMVPRPVGADRRSRVGVDEAGMWFPVEIHRRVAQDAPHVDLVDASRLVPELRRVKSSVEQTLVRRAAELTSAAMRAAIHEVAVGVRVRDVAAAAYAELFSRGSDPPGMAPLVRLRDQLLEEHAGWSDRVVGQGDAVFVELSGSAGHYHAPMTRMIYLDEPPPGTDRAARIAADAFDAVVSTLRPGTSAARVYDAWQRVVDDSLGHARYRRHHCGYQVGIGFPPSWVGGPYVVGLRPGATWEVEEGMTFHVLSWLLDQEPADYVLSDTVLVTAHGADVLTNGPRDPIVVPA